MVHQAPVPHRRHDDSAYDGPDRRREVHLSEEQILAIASKAADIALQRMIDEGFRAVGKTVVEKALWVIGAATAGLSVYAYSKGWIRP